jgi:phosphatidylserine synthase
MGAMLCGFLSIIAANELRFVDAGWLILLATFLDRADGILARSLKATSQFGVQMDSFADFFDFGVAPAVLLFIALTTTPGLPFGSGAGYALAPRRRRLLDLRRDLPPGPLQRPHRRVARQEPVQRHPDDPRRRPAHQLVPRLPQVRGPGQPARRPGRVRRGAPVRRPPARPAAWSVFPIAMLIGGVLMVSNLRCKKFLLLQEQARHGDHVVIALALAAFTCLLLRVFPEYTVLLPQRLDRLLAGLRPARPASTAPSPRPRCSRSATTAERTPFKKLEAAAGRAWPRPLMRG